MSLTLLKIHRYSLPAVIGVHDHERNAPQPLLLNLDIWVDTLATTSDSLEDTLDYDTLTRDLTSLVGSTKFYLLERLAGFILDFILRQAGVSKATIELIKPGALAQAEAVSVVLSG